MAATEVKLDTPCAVEQVWDLVADMNNWAPLMPGYESHTEVDATHSVWKIRGDVGPFSRVVDFAVEVTTWEVPAPDGRIAFTLNGLNEFVDGSGEFKIERIDGVQRSGEDGGTQGPRDAPGILERIYLFIYRLLSPFKKEKPSDVPNVPDQLLTAQTRIVLQLQLNPKGAMGGFVDKLIAPLLGKEAEEFGRRIIDRVEAT